MRHPPCDKLTDERLGRTPHRLRVSRELLHRRATVPVHRSRFSPATRCVDLLRAASGRHGDRQATNGIDPSYVCTDISICGKRWAYVCRHIECLWSRIRFQVRRACPRPLPAGSSRIRAHRCFRRALDLPTSVRCRRCRLLRDPRASVGELDATAAGLPS